MSHIEAQITTGLLKRFQQITTRPLLISKYLRHPELKKLHATISINIAPSLPVLTSLILKSSITFNPFLTKCNYALYIFCWYKVLVCSPDWPRIHDPHDSDYKVLVLQAGGTLYTVSHLGFVLSLRSLCLKFCSVSFLCCIVIHPMGTV